MEAIGTLAGGIAHDFNNILFPIMGYTEMTLKNLPDDSRIRRNLEGVLKAATRAKDLVRQILAFSRHTDLKQKYLMIQPIIKEALKLLRATLPATIEIREDINKECGPVFASPTQIHQIMMNLCANAYHAMRETGGVLEVKLTDIRLGPEDIPFYPAVSSGSYLKLSVSDTGHGMTKDIMEKIFDPYFTTKDTGEGTGLGLSVVHGIVRNHNGHITVYSEPGKGTVFHIYLPLFTETFITPDVMPEEEQPPGGNEKILLIDDEEQIVDMEREMLEHLGYHVTGITKSLEALEVFRRAKDDFDLVITDMTMSHMTGAELSREILRIRPDIPIILCTGFSELVTEEKARKMGIREYVMKPMLRSEIAVAIRRVLDSTA
jgi:CheY-like chemotaxis protein